MTIDADELKTVVDAMMIRFGMVPVVQAICVEIQEHLGEFTDGDAMNIVSAAGELLDAVNAFAVMAQLDAEIDGAGDS